MNELLAKLAHCPIVASVQAPQGSPLDDTPTLLRLAQASLAQGVQVLRLEGAHNIRTIQQATGAIAIGLIKREYPDSPVKITPTLAELRELLETDCQVVAIDATTRARPGRADLRFMVESCHLQGRLVLGDCDCEESVRHALASGCDLVSTTLAGYTVNRKATDGPDLELLRTAVGIADVPVLAEGRFSQPSEVAAALRAGACGVVIGGAINDPLKQTRMFVEAAGRKTGPVGAVDIGGTWLRFGAFSADWRPVAQAQAPLPSTNRDRLDWIAGQCAEHGVTRLGVSCGGVVDPGSGRIAESTDSIPDNRGVLGVDGVDIVALNDGLATAWGSACWPETFGERVLTLAVGTGVGAGLTHDGKVATNSSGDYPRVNELLLPSGRPFEAELHRVRLDGNDPEALAEVVALGATVACRLFLPDRLVLAGSVGLAPPVLEAVSGSIASRARVSASPFGADAGLFGAAALALWPPTGVFPQ